MGVRLARFVLVGALFVATYGCNGGSSRLDGAAGLPDLDGTAAADRSPTAADGPPAGAPPVADGAEADGPSSPLPKVDAPAMPDGPAVDRAPAGTDAPVAPPPDAAASCTTQTLVLGRPGTTSSCSWKVPGTIPRDRVNLLFGGRRLCKQGSNNCTTRGGWFWFGDEVALCDATCISWEGSGANLILEAGCPSESCFVACREEGGACGDGINSCCAGFRCSGRSCVACGRGGQACTTAADCCSGSTCQNGACVGGLGSACVSQAGCSRGECRDGRCQCAADQILCSGGCVSFTDPNNCRGCGNVCGSGRVCTVDGCVCDPQSARPDECNGTCVDKATDRNNCGFCSLTCPKLEQVCVAGRCGCPGGQTECNGSCVDVSTNQNHCGTCNRGCPAPSEVCSAGTCVCAPGMTRCLGACVNLMTNKFNCGACGVACPGNKTCSNGGCT